MVTLPGICHRNRTMVINNDYILSNAVGFILLTYKNQIYGEDRCQ